MHRISMTALAVAFLLAVPPAPSAGGQPDYKRIIAEQPWAWSGEQASLLYSVTQYFAEFDTTIECPKFDLTKPGRLLTIHVRDDGRDVYSFQSPREVVFSRERDILYFARPNPGSSGCTVSAYDFRARKELWRTTLQSRSNLPHSAYDNLVTIERTGDVLMVRGNESSLRYIEYVDTKSGKSIAQREYQRE